MYTLRYVLRNPGVAAYIYAHPSVLDQYLGLLSFVEGLDPQTRASRSHIEYESNLWQLAFTL